VTSNRDRQRAGARARLERDMAERAERKRRQRRTRATIAIAAGTVVVLVGAGFAVWKLTDHKGSPSASASASASAGPAKCVWNPLVDPSATPTPQPLPTTIKNVGTPPAGGEPRTGTQVMTMNTNRGVIKIEVETAKAPCAAASFTYLAGKKFFDNTKCHRMVTTGIFVLQCGDPSATGTGGPAYRFNEENLPTNRRPAYPEGTVAIAKAQDPGTSGSQFFICYKDTELDANYTILGHVTEGLDIVQKVAAGGVIPDPQAQSAGDGAPKLEVKVTSLTMSAPTAS
jgi:peptidyl-prolyl cis-trans isomerase B (cyclophilin B)